MLSGPIESISLLGIGALKIYADYAPCALFNLNPR